jgi:hypothetical protein
MSSAQNSLFVSWTIDSFEYVGIIFPWGVNLGIPWIVSQNSSILYLPGTLEVMEELL